MKKYIISKKGQIIKIAFALIIVILAAILRLLPHPPNFAPITAMALFSGLYFNRKFIFIVPLGAMLISDYFIGFYSFNLMASVYVSFLLVGLLGFLIKKNKNFSSVIGAGILGSLIFFLITNFSFWYFMPFYEKSVSGLAQAYIMGIPFLKNALLGDIFYVLTFFGVYELVAIWVKRKFAIIHPIIKSSKT